MEFTMRVRTLGVLAAVVTILGGCAVRDRITPVSNTFLEDVDTTKRLSTLPYQHSWVSSKFDGRSYRKIFIKPVRVDRLDHDGWTRSASAAITSKDDYVLEASALAAFFRSELIEKVRSFEGGRFQIATRPGPGVAVLELAFTELEFSHPAARAASLASPIPGSGAALSSVTDPHAAFAGRLYDDTGRLVATVADRKFPPARIIDLNKLTVSSSVREVCSLWAETLAKAINQGQWVPIDANDTFSIRPW